MEKHEQFSVINLYWPPVLQRRSVQGESLLSTMANIITVLEVFFVLRFVQASKSSNKQTKVRVFYNWAVHLDEQMRTWDSPSFPDTLPETNNNFLHLSSWMDSVGSWLFPKIGSFPPKSSMD